MTKEELMNLISRSLTADLGYIEANGFPTIRRVFCTWHKGLGRHLISTNVSSSHVQRLMPQRNACLYFADSETYEGLCLTGRAIVHTERPWKELLWHPQDVMYYPGGIDDPDYCVIEFAAEAGRYYRFDGKGDLSAEEMEAFDRDAQFEDGYAKYQQSKA